MFEKTRKNEGGIVVLKKKRAERFKTHSMSSEELGVKLLFVHMERNLLR